MKETHRCEPTMPCSTRLCKEEHSAALKKEQSGAANKTPTVYDFALTHTTRQEHLETISALSIHTAIILLEEVPLRH